MNSETDNSEKEIPFTKEELVDRALKSEEDYANGRVISHEEVVRISEKW